MAAEVQPFQPTKQPKGPSALTPEQKYWLTFTSPLLLDPSQHSSPITSITYPSLPQNSLATPADTFAVTSGSRIQIISTRTRKPLKTISRITSPDVARSGVIRSDGRLVLAGGDSGAIQAFDLNSRAILKTWNEHKQPVWSVAWDPYNITQCLSFSDDRTVRLWDLPSDKSLTRFEGHQDYVRCGAYLGGQAGSTIVSGSYDQTVRIWDARTGGKAVMVFKHDAAVEAVLPLGGGTAVVSAAGNAVCVLDVVAGKPVTVLRNHQKTVTCLSSAGGGERVLSGGLDGHVKVFETRGWNVVAGMKYSSPILALSVVPSLKDREDKHVVVGLQSGVLSIKTRLSGQQKVLAREREKEMKALVEGRIEEYDKTKKRRRGKGWEKRIRGKDFTGETADIVIEGNARGRVNEKTPWGQALHAGDYARALDLVLEQKSPSFHPHRTAVLTTLLHRSALRTALSNRDELTLQPILRWLIKSISDYRIVRLTSSVGLLVLDLYGHQLGKSPEIDDLFDKLRERVNVNMEASHVAWSVGGMCDALVRAAGEAEA